MNIHLLPYVYSEDDKPLNKFKRGKKKVGGEGGKGSKQACEGKVREQVQGSYPISQIILIPRC